MLKNLRTLSKLLVAMSLLLAPLIAEPLELPQQVRQQPPKLKASRTLLKQILRNHPELKWTYAIELANTFDAVSRYHAVPARQVAAIAMQESGYVLDAKQCYKIRGRIRCDFCMMQINDHTIKRYGFDQDRLMKDLPYCVGAGVQVLSDLKKRYGKREKDWFSRYNATSRDKRDIYKELVERWM